jgi:hypothetical protein
MRLGGYPWNWDMCLQLNFPGFGLGIVGRGLLLKNGSEFWNILSFTAFIPRFNIKHIDTGW